MRYTRKAMRRQMGRIRIELVPTNIRAVAREAGELYRAQAEAKALVLQIETNVEVPTILSDPRRVRQVLGNLISNAVKTRRQERSSCA